MLIKPSAILTSVLSTLLSNRKGQRPVIFIAAIVTAILLWKLCAGHERHADAGTSSTETATNDEKMAGVKWSYDELAHKLIIENTDLAYAEAGEGFSKGIGRVLSKVTRQRITGQCVARQCAGKRIVVNL